MKTTNKHRLFKRYDDGREMPAAALGHKERPYYFRFQYRGIRYTRCLETNDAIEAQKRARAKYSEIVAAISAGAYKRLDATRLRSVESATLEQLYSEYKAGPAEAGSEARKENINALKRIAGGAQFVRELTPALIRAWFTAITVKVTAEPDQECAASIKRSANSTWAKARSLFTPKCLAWYRDRELIASDAGVAAFRDAGELALFTRIPKQNYNPPPENIITATLEAWEKLADRDLFLTIGHELAFGVRAQEMAQARWSWHMIRNDYPVIDGRAVVKSGSGIIQVRALDPYWTIMKRVAVANDWWPKESPDALIIQGTETYRTDDLFRAVSAWMRALGWETQKTNHALRAYAASQIAMRYGIYDAQVWLRHSSVKVTEQNYSHFVQKFKPADLDTVPAKWATNATEKTKVASAKPDAILEATSELRQPPLDSSKVLPWTAHSRN